MKTVVSRFLAVLLGMLLIVPQTSNPSYAESYYTDEVIDEFNYQFDFLSSLGVFGENEVTDMSNEVTRSEYAKIISRLNGYTGSEKSTGGTSVFADVNTYDENYSYIKNAVDNGWLSVNGSIFRPNTVVSTDDVLASLLKTLKYDKFLNGSNKTNTEKARQIKLLNGVEEYISYSMTYGALSAILINALDTSVVEDTGASYVISKQTLLENRYAYTKNRGVVTAAGASALSGDMILGENRIRIDNEQYSVDKDYGQYLGYSVDFFSNDDQNIVFMRPRKNKNKITTLYSEELEDFSNQSYTYTLDNGKIRKTIKLDSGCSVLYNKRAVSVIDKNLMLPKDGYVKLIDNNNDGLADVVFVMSYQILSIYSIEPESYIIYDKKDLSNKLSLNDAANNETLYVYDGNGQLTNFNKLKYDSVIIAYISKDNQVAEIHISDYIEGSITGMDSGNDEITVDGIQYKTAHNLNFSDISTADKGRIYLDENGKMIYFKKQSAASLRLGYVLRVGYDEIEGKLFFKVLTQDNIFVQYIASEKINIDGTVYKNSENAFHALSAVGTKQLVQYLINDEGNVCKIFTANYTNNKNSLRITYPRATKQYINSQRSFYGAFGISGDTLIFRIPTDAAEDYDSYSVFTSSYLDNANSYTVEAYNIGEGSLIADAVLLYETADKMRSFRGVVSEKGVRLEDGDPKSYITIISQWSTRTFSTEQNDVLKNISTGDFVECSYDARTELKRVSVIYDYSERKFTQASNPTSSFAIGNRYLCGRVYEKHGTAISVSTKEITSGLTRDECEILNTELFPVYKMDETLSKPIPVKASSDDIYDYLHMGSECSEVLVYTQGETPCFIMIY